MDEEREKELVIKREDWECSYEDLCKTSKAKMCIDQWAMAKPMDITFHCIHGFCHGTMGNAIIWQNPYTMTFATVYDFCHA